MLSWSQVQARYVRIHVKTTRGNLTDDKNCNLPQESVPL